LGHLSLTYQIEIVTLSILIAIFGSYTSFELMIQSKSALKRRVVWLISSSFIMGISVWAMHFIGMSSLHPVTYYDEVLTYISLLASILVTTLAFLPFYQNKLTVLKMIYSGLVFGLGIVSMHLLGVMAMKSMFAIHYHFKLVSISIGHAIFFMMLTMNIWKRLLGKPNLKFVEKIGNSIFLGLVVSTFHYLAMYSMKYTPIHHQEMTGGINPFTMAISVSFAIFVILSFALLISHKRKIEAEQKAVRKEAKYRSLFHNNHDGIFIMNGSGIIVESNSAVEMTTGFSNEEVIGARLLEFVHPNDIQASSRYFREALQGISQEFKMRIFHKDGRLMLLQVKNVPLFLHGKVDGVFVIIKDITVRSKMKQQLVKTQSQMESFFQCTNDAINITTLNGKLKYVNPSFEKMFGWRSEELLGKPLPIIPNHLHEESNKMRAQLLNGGHINAFEAEYVRKDGSTIDVSVTVSPLKDAYGQIYAFAAITRDISERIHSQKILQEKDEQYQQALELSEKRYRLIAENSTDLIRIVDINGMNRYVSPSHEHVLGFKPEELDGKRFDEIIYPADKEMINQIYQNHFPTPQEIKVEYRFQHKNGSCVWLEAISTPVYDKDLQLSYFLVVSRDITERKIVEEQLKEMAFYDSLTGIPNRRLFLKRLSQCTQEANENHNGIALFYLDCDRFKWVNDTYGHETGDLLLKGMVDRVKACIRPSDMIARLGGDEFAILINGYESVQELEEMANSIILSLRNPWELRGNEFITTSSIGIAIYPEDGADIDTLLAHVDQALYESKEQGRNRYHFYTKKLATKMERIMLLEDGLKGAVSKGHLHLVYQPKVNIQKGKMHGLEVLLRYTHPVLGEISPAEFIPLCEKLSIIDDVTEWVMRESFKQQKDWERNGYGQIHISINISPTTIEKPSFLQTVQYYLKQFKVNPESIEFELTEDALLHNIDAFKLILHDLKKTGIKISLDDFGAGYSSLKYLKELPIDILKIDRSFIMGVPFEEKEKAIIESILSLTQRINGQVVCEGVETEEQLKFLQDNGCQIVQGYYFSRPLTKEELEVQWLKPSIAV
jgi:diguanylate cyclase (GGDEF)-like protein/PAS domain S-box-containing protein